MANQRQPLRLLGDAPFDYPGHPEARLARDEISRVLRHLNALLPTSGGLVTAVKGDWGTGKTSVLKAIESYYRDLHRFPVVFFEAWKYQEEEQPLVPLLQSIIRALEKGRSSKWRDDALKSLRKTVLASMLLAAGQWLLPPGVSITDVKEALKTVEGEERDLLALSTQYDDYMAAMTEVIRKLPSKWKAPIDGDRRTLWEEYIKGLSAEEQNELLNPLSVHEAAEPRLVLIIDDLDRCLPQKGFAILEAVRFHLAVEGVLVVMGVDDRILGRFVERHYGLAESGDDAPLFSGREFLDKVFHWSHELRFAGFDAVRDVCFDDCTLDTVAQDLLDRLNVPYRTWVRIRNRIAGACRVGGMVPNVEVWLAVLVELVPAADHLLRTRPGDMADIATGTFRKELVGELLKGAREDLAQNLMKAYDVIRESGV